MNQKRATSVAFFILITYVLGHASIGLAQEAVYRCGSIITNDAAQAKREKCQLLEGGAVVTVPSHKRAVEVTKPAKNTEQQAVQRQRDSDAKAIIEAELKKTEAQLADLRKQYAEVSTSQDLERKLAIKQQIARHESDVVSLKRELKR